MFIMWSIPKGFMALNDTRTFEGFCIFSACVFALCVNTVSPGGQSCALDVLSRCLLDNDVTVLVYWYKEKLRELY